MDQLYVVHMENCNCLPLKYQLNEYACIEAAGRGHVDCLRNLYKSGSPYVDACNEAAKCGKLQCLRYLHENGCPWTVTTCTYAARHIVCLKYARENGCPWNKQSCMRVGNQQVRNWIMRQLPCKYRKIQRMRTRSMVRKQPVRQCRIR